MYVCAYVAGLHHAIVCETVVIDNLCMYMYVCTCMCLCMYACMHMHEKIGTPMNDRM